MFAHIDVDAFFASAILRKHPSLKGKPLLVLGMGGGCVIAASYEAKDRGVKTGMPLKEALKFAPNAIRLPADFHEAALGSKEIETFLCKTCSILEKMSIDEWFLALEGLVGGLPPDISAWAQNIQKNILQQTALMVSIGIAPTKTLAKMASEYKKPAGLTIIDERNIPHTSYEILLKDFLHLCPAAAIPGIGPRRKIHTDAHGWLTAWDIAQAPANELIRLFGKPGGELRDELRGISVYPVRPYPDPPKSVSRCRSFSPTKNRDVLWAHILRHAEYTVTKMRREGLMCRGITLWLRQSSDGDYVHLSSDALLPQPAQTVEAILPVIRRCMEEIHRHGVSYTQAGLALRRMIPACEPQYSLFEPPLIAERGEAIQKSLDLLHERFGRNSVTRGSALSVKTGTSLSLDTPVYW